MNQSIRNSSLRNIFLITVGTFTVLLLLFFLLVPRDIRSDALSSPTTEAGFVINSVQLFDGYKWHPSTNVYVSSGVVQAIGIYDDFTLEDVEQIDGQGKSILPGLIDAHTHSYGDALADSLRFGVTTNLDMFSAPYLLGSTIAQRNLSTATDVADLYSAGMLATVAKGHGTQFGVPIEHLESPTQADEWVQKRKAEGSDYIKLVYMPYQSKIPSIDLPVARALIDAAHGEDLLAVAHIATQRGASDMVESGIDGLVHIFADQEITEEFIELISTTDTFVIPTLAVIFAYGGGHEGPELALDPRLAPYLTKTQKASLTTILKQDAAFTLMNPAIALHNVKRLYETGVVLLAGSDSGNPGTTHGASLHLELELLVRAGLTPTAALKAASSEASRVFGLGYRGSVDVGQRADLLLVQGNPLENIHATRAIEKIWKNGFEVRRLQY